MGEDTSTSMDAVEKGLRKNKCNVNKNLVMLKLALFLLYGANSSLQTYLTVHMKSIGLTLQEMSLISLALPFTTFLAPPITGYLADKFGKYKPVVVISFLLAAILHHSLLLIPHQEQPGVQPPGYVITHPKKLYVEVWWSPCPSRECPETEELDLILDSCEDYCLLKKRGKPNTNITKSEIGYMDDLYFHIEKKKKNRTNFDEPSTGLAPITLDIKMHPNLGDPIEQFGMELESGESSNEVTDLKKRGFGPRLLRRFGVNVPELDERDLRCGGVVTTTSFQSQSLLKNYSYDCILQKCNFVQGGPDVCPPEFKESSDNVFWIYFTLRMLAQSMLTTAVTVMDPIALSMIEKFGGDFGKEKLFSSFGMAMFSPLVGMIIDLTSSHAGYTDYSAAFYSNDVLMVLATVAVIFMPLDTKLPADNVFRDVLNIIRIPRITLFIFFLFMLGNIWGFIETYLFLFLQEMGASTSLLGITVTVGTLSSIPFLYGADKITKKIGHINVIIIAFFAHSVRLLGYSIIESPWWVFPFEAMESLSVHLMWVAAATYCALIAPNDLLATLIGVVGMSHFSIGRGSGSFVGGHILIKYGIRQAFRIVGTVAVVSGVLYFIIHYVWFQNDDSKLDNDDDKSDSEKHMKDVGTDPPAFKDQSTMMSNERLSLMIEYNQIGSVTSLGRSTFNVMRRGSYSFGTTPKNVFKVDLLKSTIDSKTNLTRSLSRTLNKTAATSMGKIPSIQVQDSEISIPNETDELMYQNSSQSISKKDANF